MRRTYRQATFALMALATLLFATFADAKDGVVEVKGTVTSMPASGFVGDWTIGGKSVQSTADTIIDQEDGPLVVGATVEAKGTPGEGGVLVATKIEVESASGTPPPPPPPGAATTRFEGIVEAMPVGGFVGDWVIGGKAVRSSAATKIEQEDGPLVVGANVEVKGTLGDGGVILAAKIEVEEAGDDNGSMDDGEIKGAIEALPVDTFIGTWTVAGQQVIVLTTTRLDQEDGGFVLGAIVEVHGTPGPDGLVASKIETKSSVAPPEPEDDLLKIEGLIEMLPADGLVGLWKVAGVDVQVTATTKLEEEDGPFAVGVPVEVKGFPLVGGGIEATKIETESGNGAPVPALMFFGTVEAMPVDGMVGVWTIGGRTVNVTDATELEDEVGPLGDGDDGHPNDRIAQIGICRCDQLLDVRRRFSVLGANRILHELDALEQEDAPVAQPAAEAPRLRRVQAFQAVIGDAVRQGTVEKQPFPGRKAALDGELGAEDAPLEPGRIGLDLVEAAALFQFGVDVGPRRLGHHPETPPGEFVDNGRLAGARRSGDHAPFGQARRGGEAAAGHASGSEPVFLQPIQN